MADNIIVLGDPIATIWGCNYFSEKDANGNPYQEWDGSTVYKYDAWIMNFMYDEATGTWYEYPFYFEGFSAYFPSASANEYIPVYGEGSLYCLKLELAQIVEYLWEWKSAKISITDPVVSLSSLASGSLTWVASNSQGDSGSYSYSDQGSGSWKGWEAVIDSGHKLQDLYHVKGKLRWNPAPINQYAADIATEESLCCGFDSVFQSVSKDSASLGPLTMNGAISAVASAGVETQVNNPQEGASWSRAGGGYEIKVGFNPFFTQSSFHAPSFFSWVPYSVTGNTPALIKTQGEGQEAEYWGIPPIFFSSHLTSDNEASSQFFAEKQWRWDSVDAFVRGFGVTPGVFSGRWSSDAGPFNGLNGGNITSIPITIQFRSGPVTAKLFVGGQIVARSSNCYASGTERPRGFINAQCNPTVTSSGTASNSGSVGSSVSASIGDFNASIPSITIYPGEYFTYGGGA